MRIRARNAVPQALPARNDQPGHRGDTRPLLRRVGRSAALTFLQTVGEPPNVVVRSSRELDAAAQRNWLTRYADQDFSFADAVSFAVMTERGIRDALALDHHFVVAGFQASA